MKDAMDVITAQSRFAAAVRDYTPKLSPKFQKMMPFKSGIAELRGKHASYRTIAEILANIDVPVSHDMVARFCKEVLGLEHSRRKQRKPRVRPPTQDSRAVTQAITNREHAPSGPRVANPDDI